MVVLRFSKDRELVVLAIAFEDDQLLVELSQRIMLPVYPFRVKIPEFVPEHTFVSELTVPGLVAVLTVMVASEELSDAQIPDCITALYFVVVLRFK